jgi:hypothetical protein
MAISSYPQALGQKRCSVSSIHHTFQMQWRLPLQLASYLIWLLDGYGGITQGDREEECCFTWKK